MSACVLIDNFQTIGDDDDEDDDSRQEKAYWEMRAKMCQGCFLAALLLCRSQVVVVCWKNAAQP